MVDNWSRCCNSVKHEIFISNEKETTGIYEQKFKLFDEQKLDLSRSSSASNLVDRQKEILPTCLNNLKIFE